MRNCFVIVVCKYNNSEEEKANIFGCCCEQHTSRLSTTCKQLSEVVLRAGNGKSMLAMSVNPVFVDHVKSTTFVIFPS